MQEIRHNGINNEFLVRTYFIARKGSDAVDQQGSRSLDVSFQKSLKTTVNLEAVATIPVSATPFGGHLLCLWSEQKETIYSCTRSMSDFVDSRFVCLRMFFRIFPPRLVIHAEACSILILTLSMDSDAFFESP